MSSRLLSEQELTQSKGAAEPSVVLAQTVAPNRPASGEDGSGVHCWDVDERPDWLHDRYRRLALVSHPRHLERLDSGDETTLLVCCNWLLWQQAVNTGWHAVFIEAEWRTWEFGDLKSEVFLRASDWMYADGEDTTLFRGVSLGAGFVKEVTTMMLEYLRLKNGLSSLVSRYGPESFVYFDCRVDNSVLDDDERLSMIERLAGTLGVTLIERQDCPEPDDPFTPRAGPKGLNAVTNGILRDRLWAYVQNGFAFFTATASRLRRLASPGRPVVLLPISHLNGLPLIRGFEGSRLFPLFLARWFPDKKKLGFVASSIARGILLGDAPLASLDASDHAELASIRRRLENSWRSPVNDQDDEMRLFIRSHILEQGRLETMANNVKFAEAIIDRYRPSALLTDGQQGALSVIFLKLARKRSIPTAVTWHGIHLQDYKLEIFGTDPRAEGCADFCFTWGEVHENWLRAVGAKTTPIRTGNAIIHNLADRLSPDARGGNALLLQYAVPFCDVASLYANEYAFFVEGVRMLNALGFKRVVVKLHPGPMKVDFHQKIADYFGLDCEIHREGSFEKFLEDADIVVGPPFSGAMLEAIAAGKPYYPVFLSPTMQNPEHIESINYYRSLPELLSALQGRPPRDQREILNSFTSIDDIPDPVARVWEALERMAYNEIPRPLTGGAPDND